MFMMLKVKVEAEERRKKKMQRKLGHSRVTEGADRQKEKQE